MWARRSLAPPAWLNVLETCSNSITGISEVVVKAVFEFAEDRDAHAEAGERDQSELNQEAGRRRDGAHQDIAQGHHHGRDRVVPEELLVPGWNVGEGLKKSEPSRTVWN